MKVSAARFSAIWCAASALGRHAPGERRRGGEDADLEHRLPGRRESEHEEPPQRAGSRSASGVSRSPGVTCASCRTITTSSHAAMKIRATSVA